MLKRRGMTLVEMTLVLTLTVMVVSMWLAASVASIVEA